MPDLNPTLTTSEARENNPKAVFIGQEEGVVTPLGMYLSERNVELFAGKILSDALFGDYFFYIGPYLEVKKFIADTGKELPKTALLLTQYSDINTIATELKNLPQVKVIFLGDKRELTGEEVEKIINFFLGNFEQYLVLSTKIVSESLVSTTTKTETEATVNTNTKIVQNWPAQNSKQAAKPPVDLEPLAYTLKTEEIKETTGKEGDNKEPQPITATSAKADETRTSVQSFFDSQTKPTSSSSIKNKKGLPLAAAIITGLLILVLFPILAFFTETAFGSFYLSRQYQGLRQSNTAKVQTDGKMANFLLTQAGNSLGIFEPILNSFGQTDFYQIVSRTIQVELRLSASLDHLGKAAGNSATLLGGVTGKDKGVSYGPLISSIRGDLDLADVNLALIEAELKTALFQNFFQGWASGKIEKFAKDISLEIAKTRELIKFSQSSLQILPQFIGLYGKQTYLVLFQNNMELRPTGGFIGSYGLITYEDGVMTDFKIEDVYAADGALKGHVDPPEPIRIHLGQEHWYMRDSNWDPDFIRSAAQTAWFLDKETETKVDGVIAVDLYTAKNLLEVTGPLTLIDYDQTVSAQNLFTVAQQLVETGFFPGSTQKKDFLGTLARVLEEELLLQKTNKHLLFQKLHEAILQKHLLVYFTNPVLEQVANLNGWSGETANDSCANCIKDFTAVVDANLGVNKANYFIERSLKDSVTILENGQIQHLLVVTYKNNSPLSDESLGGVYKNYVRFLVSHEAEVTQATSNSIPLSIELGNVASQSSLVVQPGVDQTTLAHLVEVGPQTEKVLTLSYTLDRPELNHNYSYMYQVTKQPGTAADPFELTLTYPASWQIGSVGGEAPNVAGATTLVKASQITYNTDLSQDRKIYVQFGQQK